MNDFVASFFKFQERKTTWQRETIGGITSFVTMAYIIFVNPQIMAAAGMDKGTVLLSGIIFVVVSVTGLRSRIISEIPMHLKKAIGIGIGMFILYIGLKNASLLSFSANPGSFIPLGDSMKLDSSIIPALTFANDSAKLALVGIFLNIGFLLRGTRGGMLLSGFVQLFDISKGLGVMIFSLFSVMITMTIADMFDTIGTVLATASRANLVDEDGNIINGERILLADATATVMGAFFGTSTVTTYVESSTGVAAGARAGFASVVTALLFLLSVSLAPLLGMVPAAATAPVLIMVGIMMASDIGDIDWRNLEVAVPAYFTMMIMCFGYNIADGIAIGFIMFSFVKLAVGKWSEVSWLVRGLSAMFLLRFVFMLFY